MQDALRIRCGYLHSLWQVATYSLWSAACIRHGKKSPGDVVLINLRGRIHVGRREGLTSIWDNNGLISTVPCTFLALHGSTRILRFGAVFQPELWSKIQSVHCATVIYIEKSADIYYCWLYISLVLMAQIWTNLAPKLQLGHSLDLCSHCYRNWLLKYMHMHILCSRQPASFIDS